MTQFESITFETFICPITLDYFNDPVMATDGHIYEREAIEWWYQKNDTSPITCQKIKNKTLIRNFIFNNMLKEFYMLYPDCEPINVDKLLNIIDNNTYNGSNIMKYLDTINESCCDEIKWYIKSDNNQRDYCSILVIIFANENFVNFLIDNTPDNYLFTCGLYLVHMISLFGTYNMFNKIINIDDNNVEKMDENDGRLIHYVCCCRSKNMTYQERLDCIGLLLNKNVTTNICLTNGWYPIHYVCSYMCALQNDYRLLAIKMLVEKSGNLELTDSNTRTPLHLLCGDKTGLNNEYQLAAIELLLMLGANVEAQTNKNIRPIHIICSPSTSLKDQHQLTGIKILIEHGAKLDVKTLSGWQPIHMICSSSTNLSGFHRVNAIKLLIKNKVDVFVKENEGKNPIDIFKTTLRKSSKEQWYKEILTILNNEELKIDY